MLSFDNTKIAFSYKSDLELSRAHRLFKLVGNPILVRVGKWLTPLAFKLRLPIKGIIKKTIFGQFCGGETINDCDSKINTLKTYNVGTILDYSVEGKSSENDFDKTCNEIVATIHKAKGNLAIPFAVFKVTGISRNGLLEKLNHAGNKLTQTEIEEFQRVESRIDRICQEAFESKTPVFIDAEESWIQNTIDGLALTMMKKYNKEWAVVFNTAQMYRVDRLAYLTSLMDVAIKEKFIVGIKLVRGAYMEKERARAIDLNYPSPIQPDKKSCDKDFDAALELMVNNINIFSICAGTHNESSSLFLTNLLNQKKIDKDSNSIYFAQLLGMSDHISFNLAHHGYNVAKYVPYGPVKEVMPYLLRRADENTSVSGQTSRELRLISQEIKRRREFTD